MRHTTLSNLLKQCSQSLADLAQASALDEPTVTRFITEDIQPVLAELIIRTSPGVPAASQERRQRVQGRDIGSPVNT